MTSPADLPSRELDAAVAREVMGWTGIPAKAFDRTLGGAARASWTESHDAPWTGIDPVSGKALKIPHYSTDLRAMGTVLDALRERGWMYRLKFTGRDHQASIWRGADVVTEEADTLPRAVCEAALAAVGGK